MRVQCIYYKQHLFYTIYVYSLYTNKYEMCTHERYENTNYIYPFVRIDYVDISSGCYDHDSCFERDITYNIVLIGFRNSVVQRTNDNYLPV